MRMFTILLFVLISAFTISAQNTVIMDIQDEKQNSSVTDNSILQERGTSESAIIVKTVNIFPNPCPDRLLHYTPVNVTVSSYQVFKSTGEIVEIENLIGKDERLGLITLGISLAPGLYFVTFYTNIGPIVKYFTLP
ncbi:MAG: T9SS type A sorting domain-containing protein [Chitinophagales bacterium]